MRPVNLNQIMDERILPTDASVILSNNKFKIQLRSRDTSLDEDNIKYNSNIGQ